MTFSLDRRFVRRLLASSILLVPSLVMAQKKAVEKGPVKSPPEMSGIVVYKDSSQAGSPTIFAVVSDGVPGAYYKNFYQHLPAVGQDCPFHPTALRTPLNPGSAQAAFDLEDIGVLGGQIVALSENSASLISERGIAINYSGIDKLREVNDHYGLEGLAIRQLNDTQHRVAVLWEGGHDNKPQSPRVFVHTVSRDELARGTVRPKITDGKFFELNYDTLRQLTGETLPTSFRAPALVWTKIGNGDPGFVVIVSVDEKDRYHKKWLIRFDENGQPQGRAHSLASLGMRANITGKNWEGMSWTADGSALILLDDADEGTATTLCILKPPSEW